jgi:hypothetical protein
MNTDDLEQRLQREPLRRVPAEWRQEILIAAEANRCAAVAVAADVNRRSQQVRELAFAATAQRGLGIRLRKVLWPHPKAWAGLGAVWIVLLVVNFATRDLSPVREAHYTAPLSPQLRELLNQQEQLLAELVGPIETPAPTRPKPVAPQPRSQRREEFMNA